MFITNNHTLSFFLVKKTLVKHQKVWKYYDCYCVQNSSLFFIFLLTAPTVTKCHILAGIYFIFQKNGHRTNVKGFQLKI